MIIKQLVVNEEDGIQAISLVPDPAIEANFYHFGRLKSRTPDMNAKWKFTAFPDDEVVDTSHEFCKKHAGKVFTTQEILEWKKIDSPEFIPDSDFFDNFPSTSFAGSDFIYNCRHYLERVDTFQIDMNAEVKLSVNNVEARTIVGPVLISGKMIYRRDIDGLGEGYVYMTRDTVRKLQSKFGFNRKATIDHMDDITGYLVMTKTWLEEDDEKNLTTWFVEYKVVNQKLWDLVKENKVLGFSIEAFLSVQK